MPDGGRAACLRLARAALRSAASVASRFLSAALATLPEPVMGRSARATNSTDDGTLKSASLAAAWRRSAAAVSDSSCLTTTALTRSPMASSGMP